MMHAGEKFRRDYYSTDSMPPDERHKGWAERGWPRVAALFESTPLGDFSTSAEDIVLDGIAISFASGTARLLERTPDRIAADGIDILAAGLLLEGEMHGTARSREFQLDAGEILLFDMAQPITMTMSISRSVQLAVPRAMAEAQLGPVRDLHGRVIPGAPAAAVQKTLFSVRDSLPGIGEGDTDSLSRAVLRSLTEAIKTLR